MMTKDMGKAGLLWIGEQFYPTPGEFTREAEELGISRRISAVPRDFKLGETWVLFAHRKGATCDHCGGGGLAIGSSYLQRADKAADLPTFLLLNPGESAPKCEKCQGSGKLAAIFRVCRPDRIEKILTESQSRDEKLMADLERAGIRPVIVPDDDKDHQGTVYDDRKDDADVQQ